MVSHKINDDIATYTHVYGGILYQPFCDRNIVAQIESLLIHSFNRRFYLYFDII